MKMTMSKDGKLRTNLRIEVRLSIEDMGSILCAHWLCQDVNEALELLNEKSNDELISLVKEHIRSEGTERTCYTIADHNLDDVEAEIIRALKLRFEK